MRYRKALIGVLFTFALPAAAAAGPKIVIAPLAPHRPPVGLLVEASERGVTVTVRDERPAKSFTASALVGPQAEKGKGIFLAYATQKEEELAGFMASAARDAVRVLGLKEGGDYRLEIVVRDFRVTMTRFPFSPMNCLGYGRLTATLSGPDGTEVKSVTLDVAYYDGAVPKWSMKEVSEKALSRIYSLAAWQAVATVLRTAWGLEPDRTAVQAVAAKVDAQGDEDIAREMIFWLGLVAHGDEATTARLLAWVGSSRKQKVFQTAAEALGLLGVAEARERFQAALAGKKLGGWNATDNEQVWYLVHAMALLGEKDLQPLVPKGEIGMRSKIDELVAFHTSGTLPGPSAAEAKEIEAALKELAKQRE
jgi:hypothetical protein